VNLEKIIFGFFIIFACTLNFGFVIGDIDRPELHHRLALFAALIRLLTRVALRLWRPLEPGANLTPEFH